MVIGGVLGICFGALVALIVYSVVNEISDETIANFVGIMIIIVTLILGLFLGGYADKIDYKKYISEYNSKKYTIEQSLKNEDLKGLEKIELVKQATEINGELANKKVEYNTIWYFFIDKSELNKLEGIDLKGEK
jgi:high-affinity Fe2+/Pb2+ permease